MPVGLAANVIVLVLQVIDELADTLAVTAVVLVGTTTLNTD